MLITLRTKGLINPLLPREFRSRPPVQCQGISPIFFLITKDLYIDFVSFLHLKHLSQLLSFNKFCFKPAVHVYVTVKPHPHGQIFCDNFYVTTFICPCT